MGRVRRTMVAARRLTATDIFRLKQAGSRGERCRPGESVPHEGAVRHLKSD